MIIIGVTFCLIFPARAKDPSSALESFGVQKVDEKKEAIPFSLKNLNGNVVALKDFKGKPVLVAFWATWCDACTEEIGLLEKFSNGKRDQINILMLAIDGEKENKVKRVINQKKITLPVLLDPKEKTARAYGVKFIPIVFLIDREGMLVGKIVGERDWTSSEAISALREIFDLH
jgi:peroxiredoxin